MGKALIIFLLLLDISFGYSSVNKFVKLDPRSSFSIDTTGIPVKALPAIKFSFAILDSVLSTEVPINVTVNFSTTSRKEVIATGAATSYEIGFCDLVTPKFYYPISLAEKIAGIDLNGIDKADISVIVNQCLDWSFDSANLSIGTKFDFITLFTHELIHGLGFQSLIQVRSNIVDTAMLPSIFDSFVSDSNGIPLYPDYFKNGPESAYSLITSGSLFFTSSYFKTLFIGSRVPLYADKPYAAGNSIHHLNYQYDSIPPTRLMRPGFKVGEYQRYIDPFTREILHALGWNRPDIQIKKQYDVDSISAGQILQIFTSNTIKDLTIDYSFDQFRHYKSLIPECKTDICSVSIPVLEFSHSVNYRLTYTDIVYGTVTLPCETCSISYFVGDDTIKPILSNISISTVFTNTKQSQIKYQVSDNSGVTDVCLVVKQKGKTVDSICSTYIQTHLANFAYTMPPVSENDTLQFVLTASDKSKNKNTTTVKRNIVILPLGDICYSYSTDFENADDDFTLTGFTIHKNYGFISKSLDTKHPYIAPNSAQDTLFTYAILKPRIILDSTHYLMSFDEVVFVEPCEVGKQFGEFGFWDYVTVEGSNDNGHTWHIFGKEGYDATYNNDWYMSYLSNIVVSGRNKNSLAVPTEDMYRKHIINLVENKYLHKGDTVMIRFMLTSDAFSTGWGWSIDNLVIQEGAGLPSNSLVDKISIYPNPFSSEILFSENISNASYRIVSILGETVQSGIINGKSLNTYNLADGLYLISINFNGVVFYKSIAKLTH